MAILLYKTLKNLDYDKHSRELYNKIEERMLRNRKQIVSEGAFVGIVDVQRTEKFICLKAYKEYQIKAGYFDGDPNRLRETTNINGEFNSIIITAEGHVLHEVSKFFHNEDVRNLILDLFKSLGLHNVSLTEVKKFDIRTMRTFYKSASKIISLVVQEIGEIEPNPHMPSEEIERAIQDMAKGSSSITLTSGVEKNLKDSEVINTGLARRSYLKEVRGKDEEGDTFTIKDNGSIYVHLPEEFIRKSNKLYKIVEKILGIFH